MFRTKYKGHPAFGSTRVDAFVRTADAARRARVSAALESLMGAGAFDAEAVARLAARDLYADAATMLARRIVNHDGLFRALHSKLRPQFLLARVGGILGLLHDYDRDPHERLEAMRCDPTRRDAVDACFAAIGEIEWATAGPCARAVFALRTLVAEQRNG